MQKDYNMKIIPYRLSWLPLAVAMLMLTPECYAASPLDKVLNMFSPSNRAYSLVIKAREAFTNKDFDKGIELCSKSLSISPNYDYAYALRASCYREKGENELAFMDCNSAINLNTSSAHPYALRARIYAEKRDMTNGLADCSEAIRLAPTEPYSYGLRGWIHTQQGNTNAAIEDLSTAIDLNPSDLYPLQTRAQLYIQSGNFEAALADVQKGIALEGADGTSQCYIPALYAQMGKPEEALAYCDKLLHATPESPNALNAKAYILCTDPNDNIRNGEEAVRLALLAIKFHPTQNSNFMDTLACAYAEVGDFDKAIALQKEVLEINGDVADKTYLKAIQDHLKAFDATTPWRETAHKGGQTKTISR